jgi:hypothetical protein
MLQKWSLTVLQREDVVAPILEPIAALPLDQAANVIPARMGSRPDRYLYPPAESVSWSGHPMDAFGIRLEEGVVFKMDKHGKRQETQSRGIERDHPPTDTGKTTQTVERGGAICRTGADVAAAASKPDVVMVASDQTVLFEPQNQRASEWLHGRCQLTGEAMTGDTEFRVHPSRCSEIVEEMKAAGFTVAS